MNLNETKKPWCYYCRTDSHHDALCWSTRPKHWKPGPEDYEARIATLEQRLAEAERLHSELLFCVAQKIPGETCHETALRYIKERESREVPGSPQENTHD